MQELSPSDRTEHRILPADVIGPTPAPTVPSKGAGSPAPRRAKRPNGWVKKGPRAGHVGSRTQPSGRDFSRHTVGISRSSMR